MLVQDAPKRPQRSVQEWRPEPLLCKRFNVPDPFKGRPAVPTSDVARFMSDRLALPDTAAAGSTALEAATRPPAADAQLPGPPPIVPQVTHSLVFSCEALIFDSSDSVTAFGLCSELFFAEQRVAVPPDTAEHGSGLRLTFFNAFAGAV